VAGKTKMQTHLRAGNRPRRRDLKAAVGYFSSPSWSAYEGQQKGTGTAWRPVARVTSHEHRQKREPRRPNSNPHQITAYKVPVNLGIKAADRV